MTELLQQIDPDCYRSAQLLIARSELARIRRGNSASTIAVAPGEIAAGTCGPYQSATRPVIADSITRAFDIAD
jgi:hypothetical protein